MNEDLQAAPVETAETTQNNPADTAQTQEVAAPEEAQAQERTETDAERAAREASAKQRRIDRITADRYRLRAERDQLAAEVQALRQQSAPQAQGEPDTQQRAYSQEDVQTLARQTIAAERFNARCEDIVQAGQKQFKAEFGEAMRTLGEVAPLFTPQGGAEPLLESILTTDRPHEMLHYLGKNPEVAEELADLTPAQQVRRLARLEVEMASTSSTKKPTSNAPRPLTPVKPGASSDEPDAKANPEAWIKWRNKQSRS
jgi:hypothetical protein